MMMLAQLHLPPSKRPSLIAKRSIIVCGHKTSVSLEPEFWAALKDIAAARGMPIGHVVAEIDGKRKTNLSSSLRVYVIEFLRARARIGNANES